MRTALCFLVLAFSISPIVAAEPETNEKLLVDFDKIQWAYKLSAETTVLFPEVDNDPAMEIRTDAASQYPTVYIYPVTDAEAWDLRGYDLVTMEVRNPEDVPVRVLLGVNNPGANGRDHCNVASAVIGAKEKGLVTVTLGEWHGEAGHNLELANITSFEVLLDKPGRAHTFVVDNIKAVKREKFDLQTALKDPVFQSMQPALGRGINLGNALDGPNEGEWGVTLEESYFAAIANAGFDSIRLPVRWSNHAEHAAPYTIDPKFLARVDWAVDQALSRGLKIVVNIHHYEGMDSHPDDNRARFLALWEQIAAHYRERPDGLYFELLNEPHDNLTAGKWNAILAEALAIVRKTNPTRTVIVGPVAWNGIGELKSLELPEADRDLIVTVHYYGPFTFTHQGAHWLGPKGPPVGTKWTGSDAEKAAVLKDFDTAAMWSLKHRRPIYLGEFGAYEKADLDSRVRWTKFIADTAAERRMSTAYWEFCSGFGAYDPVKHAWIEPLRDALVPKR